MEWNKGKAAGVPFLEVVDTRKLLPSKLEAGCPMSLFSGTYLAISGWCQVGSGDKN